MPTETKQPVGYSFAASEEERAELMGLDRSLLAARATHDEVRIQFYSASAQFEIMKDALLLAQELLNDKIDEIKKKHGALDNEEWTFNAGQVTFTKTSDAPKPDAAKS